MEEARDANNKVRWYHTVGWLRYMMIAIPVVAILGAISLVSARARRFLTKQLPDAMGWVFGIYEDKVDWVVYFMLTLMYGGIVYFILFAPYGVLCYLKLRPCG